MKSLNDFYYKEFLVYMYMTLKFLNKGFFFRYPENTSRLQVCNYFFTSTDQNIYISNYL